jgi:Ni,Fe-hydrogenase III small subunit
MCVEVCPTGAIQLKEKTVDLGKCLFCTDCADSCPNTAINHSNDYRLSVSKRQDMIVAIDDKVKVLGAELNKKIKNLFGRSLKLRQVSAGGCNACEADVNVLNTVGWDLGRFGIQVVASPRHADGVLVTGPVSKNMKLALQKTYDATPAPKVVIAVGTCAISGGIFSGHDEVCNGVTDLLPIDLYIPGCPPHPLTILDGLLQLVGRI